MLILTRKVGQKIVIGENVVIEVLGVHGYAVRIGINAPKEIPVHREEVYEKVKADKANGIVYKKREYPNATQI